MSFVNEISANDANDHGYMHPTQFVGKINNCLKPWRLIDIRFDHGASGKMIMKCYLVDMTGYGATRINEDTLDKERAHGIEVCLPLGGLLPTKDELEIFLELVRQDLQIAGTSKIIITGL